MRANLAKVQWLSIAELVEMWAPEIAVPRELMIRELRYGLYKYERSRQNHPEFVCGQPLKKQPPENELPPVDEPLLYKEFMLAFCEKQGWPLPRSWPYIEGKPRGAGRPAKMNAIVQELRRRAERCEL